MTIRLKSALAAAVALMLPASLSQAADKPEQITIGNLNLVNAQLVAKHLALHEKAFGVPVKWVKFGSGGDVNRAFSASQLDFGGVGNPPAAIGVTREIPYLGIFVLNELGAVEALAVKKDQNIKSLQDLAGKRVGAPFGSTTHYLTIAALRDAGVTPTDVKLLDLSPSDAVAAWLRGDIDAAYIWEPNLGKLVANGGEILTDSGALARKNFPTWDIAVVTKDFAAKYPDLVASFVKAECEAVDIWNNNPGDAARIVAEELSLPLEDAARMIKGTHIIPCSEQVGAAYIGAPEKKGAFVDTLVATATFLKGENRLPTVKDRSVYEAFLAPEYLKAALKEKP
jgi:taurine transport system substrate-binding protein